MSWVKATVRFFHAWRHPDEIAREVEAELRFHIEMRTRANIEGGMRPDEARLAARQSFGDFDEVKTKCCEIGRSLLFDSTVLKMATYITIAVLAGGAALWQSTYRTITLAAFCGSWSPSLFWHARSSSADAQYQQSGSRATIRAAFS